jgi:hypothetical protein
MKKNTCKNVESVIVEVKLSVDIIHEIDWLKKDMSFAEFIEEALLFYISHIKEEEAKHDWM